MGGVWRGLAQSNTLAHWRAWCLSGIRDRDQPAYWYPGRMLTAA